MWNTVLIAVWILGWLVTTWAVAKYDSFDRETTVVFGVALGWLWFLVVPFYVIAYMLGQISLFCIWLAKKI